MITANNIYKFRSKILKNLYNNMSNTRGNLTNSISTELEGKVEKIEFGIQDSYIKIFAKNTDNITDIINTVDRNLREFILSNKERLELTIEEEESFNEFITSCSLYEFFIIGGLIQFGL